MDTKNIKSAAKVTPVRALLLICISVGTAISLIYSFNVLDKPNFEISTWFSVSVLLFAIVCAWRVAISEDERQNAALIQSSNSVDTLHAWGRDEFGEKMP